MTVLLQTENATLHKAQTLKRHQAELEASCQQHSSIPISKDNVAEGTMTEDTGQMSTALK